MNSFVVLKYLKFMLMPPASLAFATILGLVLLACGWRRLGWAAILTASILSLIHI